MDRSTIVILSSARLLYSRLPRIPRATSIGLVSALTLDRPLPLAQPPQATTPPAQRAHPRAQSAAQRRAARVACPPASAGLEIAPDRDNFHVIPSDLAYCGLSVLIDFPAYSSYAPDIDISTAMTKLLRAKLTGAPVVDAQGHLLGILTERDCLKAVVGQAVAGGVDSAMRRARGK